MRRNRPDRGAKGTRPLLRKALGALRGNLFCALAAVWICAVSGTVGAYERGGITTAQFVAQLALLIAAAVGGLAVWGKREE